MSEALRIIGLTDRQMEAVDYVFLREFSRVDTAYMLKCTKQTFNRMINVAFADIARVYEYWWRHGEGYAINNEGER